MVDAVEKVGGESPWGSVVGLIWQVEGRSGFSGLARAGLGPDADATN